jgi:small subunit ribosomal protein S1
VGDSIKAKIITNENDKVSLSIREVDGNPFDELQGKKLGDIVTCNVVETGDFGLKVRVGENGPLTVIKRNELALRKSDARPDRWAKNDKLDASITNIDHSSYKLSLSVRAMEETTEREAMEKYGSKDSGASLGAILGKALGRDKKED